MREAAYDPVGVMDPAIFGLPVDREILFSNYKNAYKKRVEKRQRKLIIKLPFLKPFLKKGEKIMLITTGYSPLASMAQYLTGFFFVFLRRSLFVFTNMRIFHIPSTLSYTYKNSIAQIAYAGCHSIALNGGTLVVRYAKFGKIEKFGGIAGAERKKIKALFKKHIPISGTKSHLGQRVHRCPRCTHSLAAGKYRCRNCQLKFKHKLVGAITSILIPGGGYFYTRYHLIGIISAVLEILLLVFIAFLANDILNHIPVDPIYLVLIPLIFLFEKTASVIYSNYFISEFIPTDKNINPLKASRLRIQDRRTRR